MTGLIGGHRTGAELTELVENLHHEPWYDSTRIEGKKSGFALLEHGDRDPQTNHLWENRQYQLAIYGIISNFNDLGWSMADIAEGLHTGPDEVLPHLEGPFLIASHDKQTGRFRVATDKLGSRPCYYTNQHKFQLSSSVSGLIPAVTAPTVSRRGISDLLLFGAPLGTHTLVEEIQALPPATVLTYVPDDRSVDMHRYWKPTSLHYAQSTTTETEYVNDWIAEYQRSIGNLTDSIDGELGVWLSGGIDSRTVAITLQNDGQPFTTYTYETSSESDPPVARKVANALGVRNYQVNSGPPEKLCSGIKKAISITDGMQAWSYLVSLPFMTHELSEFTDIVIEGSRFLGEDLWADTFQRETSPTEMMLRQKAKLPESQVEKLVGVSNAAASIQQDLQHADSSTLPSRLQNLDAMRRFYGYTHMRSNVIQRSQVGTRVVSDGDMVNLVMNMPDSLRMQTLPGTKGKLPYGAPKIKLEVMREMESPATEIPYQRSMVKPEKSLKRHVAGFYAREVKEKLLSTPYRPYLDAYRERPAVQQFLNGLLNDAKERDIFDADEITSLQDQTLSGERNDITPLAAITGVEYWFQTILEDTKNYTVASTV